MPLVVWRWSPAPQIARYERPELQHPSTDGLIADLQPALGQQVFDIPIAQSETQIKPDRPPDHIGREAVASVRNRLHGPALAPFARERRVNVSMPPSFPRRRRDIRSERTAPRARRAVGPLRHRRRD